MRTVLGRSLLVTFFSLLIFVGTPALTFGAGFARVLASNFSWEKDYSGTRQTSMGNADMAGAQGPSALLLNVAPLPSGTGLELEYGRTQFVNDVDIEVLGFATQWKGLRVGYSRLELVMDPFLVRTAYEPDGTGEYVDISEVIDVLGISYDLGRLIESDGRLNWTVGGAVRRYQNSIDGNSASQNTKDLGTSLAWRSYYSRGWVRFKGGVSSMNRSGDSFVVDERESMLPQAVRYGLTAESALTAQKTDRELLRLVVAYGKTEHDNAYPAFQDHFGVEVVALKILALRGGRNSRFDGPHSWGAGLTLDRPFMGPAVLHLDYGRYNNGYVWTEMWSLRGELNF